MLALVLRREPDARASIKLPFKYIIQQKYILMLNGMFQTGGEPDQ